MTLPDPVTEASDDRGGSDEKTPLEDPVLMEDDRGSPPPPRMVSIPGPGVFEAFGWLVGVIMLHLVATAIAIMLIVLGLVIVRNDPKLLSDQQQLQLAINDQIGLVMGGDQLLFVIAVTLLVGLRLAVPPAPSSGPWTRLLNRLGRQKIRWPHLAMIVAIVIPVSVSCGQLFVVANRVWQQMLKALPGLPDVQTVQEVNVLSNLAEGLPLPALVFVLAVLPAIGEELVFRGVIGRGLVARTGVVRGVFMTSLLFSVAHLHPAHQLSVFPLGVLLHVIYLATRSILAPILLHFLVNGWAAVLAKASVSMKDQGEGAQLLGGDELMAWYVLLPAVLASLAAVVFFWRSRIEFQEADGKWWWPIYRSVETPLGPAVATRLNPPLSLVMGLVGMLLCFYVVAGWEIYRLVGGG
ncbi:MAG: hypothetical protein CMJ68_14915 [Planctomycetaceae bacterium]|jgi:membrane protease YdiL (CAAX protease family)|nr:hypothetical protein [Planctomycetaceae bacterium]